MYALHVHSHYSFMDALASIKEIAEAAAEKGLRGVAICDHGTCAHHYDISKLIDDSPVPLAYGVEFYAETKTKKFAKGSHLTVIALDQEGLFALWELRYLASKNKNRLKLEWLTPHIEHLHVSTACLRGVEPEELLEVIGNNFVVEIMSHADNPVMFEGQGKAGSEKEVMRRRLEWAIDNNVPAIFTDDAHYLYPRGGYYRSLLVSIKQRKPYHEFKVEWSKGLHLHDESEAREKLSHLTNSETIDWIIRNTYAIGEMVFHNWKNIRVPRAPAVDEESAVNELIFHMMRHRHFLDEEYTRYLEKELRALSSMRYVRPYVDAYHVVRLAKKKRILVGAGRGSAAASLILFLLGVTAVDPVKHKLLLERFVHEQRLSPPDIDIDIQSSRRGELCDALRQFYGQLVHIGNIASFTPPKLAVEIARSLNKPTAELQQYAQSIEGMEKLSHDYDNDPHFQRLLEELDIKREVEVLMSARTHFGVHAAGVVVGERILVPMRDYQGRRATDFDMNMLKDLGYQKIDVLGVDTLDWLAQSVEVVDYHGDNPRAWELIRNGYTVGMFHVNTRLNTRYASAAKVSSVSDLANILALCRPGPMRSGYASRYLQGGIEFKSPLLREVFETTRGIMLFQEQAMKLFAYAGYSSGELDRTRKLFNEFSPEARQEVERRLAHLYDSLVKQGVDPNEMSAVVRILREAFEYAFNMGHAYSYATTAYATAAAKASDPARFYANYLNVRGRDVLPEVLHEAPRLGVTVVEPDLLRSPLQCESYENFVLLGLNMIERMTPSLAQSIVKARNGCTSVEELLEKLKPGKRKQLEKVMLFTGMLPPPTPTKHEWEDILRGILNCKACELSGERVIPERGGDEVLIVGEMPGRTEIKEGRPFVGRSGRMLREAITGFSHLVTITNTCKCFANTKPSRSQIRKCCEHLLEEFLLIKPKIVCLLGKTALTSADYVPYKSIAKTVIVIEHPAAALRSGDRTWTGRFRRLLIQALKKHNLLEGES